MFPSTFAFLLLPPGKSEDGSKCRTASFAFNGGTLITGRQCNGVRHCAGYLDWKSKGLGCECWINANALPRRQAWKYFPPDKMFSGFFNHCPNCIFPNLNHNGGFAPYVCFSWEANADRHFLVPPGCRLARQIKFCRHFCRHWPSNCPPAL